MKPGAILTELRHHTRPFHDEIEREMNLFREDLSTRDYVEILKAFRSFYVDLKAQWDQSEERPTAWLPDFQERLENLAADLVVFGELDLPEAPCLRPSLSREEWWGIFYVVEGSALGGQVIRRHFSERSPALVDALRYFTGHGDGTRDRWIDFVNHLESNNPPHAAPAIAESAAATFARLTLAMKTRLLAADSGGLRDRADLGKTMVI